MSSKFIAHALVTMYFLCFTFSMSIGSNGKRKFNEKTIIEMENGDIYDCINFYKQPAFHHPLLKNNSFHPKMRPSSRPRRQYNDKFPKAESDKMSIDLMKFKNGGCPFGTVPIRKMNDTDLFQTQLPPQFYSRMGASSYKDGSHSNSYFAVAQSKNDPTKKYYGLGATITVYNPRVKQSQTSSGEIILRSGADAIIVGWTVTPNVYKDDKTRFFIYTVAQDKHCFNSECGFISVREDVPLDFILGPSSIMGKKIYIFKFFVYQDENNGNWWLQIGSNSTVIGFWPKEVFGDLRNSASYFACGGETYNPSEMDLAPMGTGFKPFSDYPIYNSFCRDIFTVDDSHKIVPADDLDTYSDDEYYGVSKGHDTMFNFGGPLISRST